MTEESIRSKLAFFEEALAQLDQLSRSDLETFLGRFETLQATLHLIQVAIQVLIDLASFAAAKLGLPAAPSSRAVLEGLETAGHLPPGSAARFGPMLAFRNRVVHLYERIDPAIVFSILRERRDDLRELRRLLVDLL